MSSNSLSMRTWNTDIRDEVKHLRNAIKCEVQREEGEWIVWFSFIFKPQIVNFF